MSDDKAKLLDALNTTVTDIDDFTTTPIPELYATQMPTTVDEAQIVVGKVSHNINEVIRAFSGLVPVELLLRIGQKNQTVQSLLLAGLESIGKSSGISVISPVEGGEYFGWFTHFEIETEPIATKVILTVKGERLEMEKSEGGKFTKDKTVGIGTNGAKFTAYYDTEESVSTTVNFKVLSWKYAMTFPENGGDYTIDEAKEIYVNTENSTPLLESVTVECSGKTQSLLKAAENWAISLGTEEATAFFSEIISAGTGIVTFIYGLPNMDAIRTPVRISIHP